MFKPEQGASGPHGEGHAGEYRAGTPEMVHVESFEPSDVRPWRYHNRAESGMDDASLDSLAESRHCSASVPVVPAARPSSNVAAVARGAAWSWRRSNATGREASR